MNQLVRNIDEKYFCYDVSALKLCLIPGPISDKAFVINTAVVFTATIEIKLYFHVHMKLCWNCTKVTVIGKNYYFLFFYVTIDLTVRIRNTNAFFVLIKFHEIY